MAAKAALNYSVSLHTASNYVSVYDGRSLDSAYDAHTKLLRILQYAKGTGSVYFNKNNSLTVTHIVNGEMQKEAN